MHRVLVIGGSDAGIGAALRARELAPDSAVTVVVADAYPNYSVCGIPFYVSGEVPDWHSLAHRSVAEIEREGIQLSLDHVAEEIDPAAHSVNVRDAAGSQRELAYDRLIIATGAVPVEPPIGGLDLPGVYKIHTMDDSLRVERAVTAERPSSAAIIGAGYIGLEMADALTRRGVKVTLLVRGGGVFRKAVDASLGQAIEAELLRHGVEVIKDVQVDAIRRDGSALVVSGTPDKKWRAEMVLCVAGVRPNAALAERAGVEIGIQGAIRVNLRMETNLPHVYAAGDCVETWQRVTQDYGYIPLGTTAHKQGRIAGENAVGGRREFAGVVGTQVVKVFDLAVARTGLREAEAVAAGFDPFSVELPAWDHKAYYPDAHELLMRITGDRRSGRLLGAQIVGHWQGQVAKRIDIFACALFHGMSVEALNDLDLSYTPPLGSPWDAVQLGAQAWARAHRSMGL